LKTTYKENNIVVFGYSLGTAPAALLAADNNPKMVILQAPYYSGSYAVKDNYPFLYSIIPSFLLKYKLETYKFIKQTKVPIVIFHGKSDSTFNINQSYRLKKLFKSGDELIVLENQGHNGFTENQQYVKELGRVLLKQ
jgi:pimeloyl-ACP methyl ester carboxylesterase